MIPVNQENFPKSHSIASVCAPSLVGANYLEPTNSISVKKFFLLNDTELAKTYFLSKSVPLRSEQFAPIKQAAQTKTI